MNIIVQTTCGYAYSLNGKIETPQINLLISQEIFYWNQVKINNFGDLPISMSYGSPSKPRIVWVVILMNYSSMYQYHHTNTQKYGVWESTPSMGVLKERILMIDHIAVI